ncbi:C39 family peptidase [Candidatus Kaiserbacteria bacterium]|nr:C39 family peptidase [Candidatus Kaiserbacteria bacterium]
MKLNLPHVTQQNNAIRNDCGPACVAMLTERTIDDVLAVTGKRDQQLHMSDIMQALRHYGVDNEHHRPIHLPDARSWLSLGYPIIALVGYGRLPADLKGDPKYNGNHYVLLTGFTIDGFLIHDPLQPQGWVLWSDSALVDVWSYPTKAMPLQGIVVTVQREIVEPEMAEFGIAVNDGINTSIARHYLDALHLVLGVKGDTLAERQGHALAKLAMLRGAK